MPLFLLQPPTATLPCPSFMPPSPYDCPGIPRTLTVLPAHIPITTFAFFPFSSPFPIQIASPPAFTLDPSPPNPLHLLSPLASLHSHLFIGSMGFRVFMFGHISSSSITPPALVRAHARRYTIIHDAHTYTHTRTHIRIRLLIAPFAAELLWSNRTVAVFQVPPPPTSMLPTESISVFSLFSFSTALMHS
ncbi:hypothetical protein GY45DRAFT_1052792 [Cubamyces sp. BRFM 1775]|nr:hypothetical protein GY45DRAFT_1052792 [Cubamyces sp. BRFM 1775]